MSKKYSQIEVSSTGEIEQELLSVLDLSIIGLMMDEKL